MKQLKVVMLAGLIAFAASLAMKMSFAAQTGNVWEARDKNNQFFVFITTGTTPGDADLDGAGLDAADVDRGELSNTRLNAAVSLLGQTIESSEITSVDAATKLTGQVPIANGGTAGATAAAARANLAVAGLGDANTFTSSQTFKSTVTVQAADAGATHSQQWKNFAGTDVASMSASGQMSALSFIGDGSNLSGVQANTVHASSVTPGTYQASGTAFFAYPSTLTIAGLDFLGSLSGAQIGARTCASRPCVAYNSADFDWYTTTGPALGQFRNSRTGTGVTQ
jgi:hypothetical protein